MVIDLIPLTFFSDLNAKWRFIYFCNIHLDVKWLFEYFQTNEENFDKGAITTRSFNESPDKNGLFSLRLFSSSKSKMSSKFII